MDIGMDTSLDIPKMFVCLQNLLVMSWVAFEDQNII